MNLDTIACAQGQESNLTVVPSHDTEQRDGGGQAGQTGAKPEGARKIEQSIAYMMQHLSQPLHVARLAQTAHISPSHFFVLFKRWTGFSPIDYFIRLRMQEACRLLVATPSSVKEIAADLGYDDPFYFSRLFKSVHGVAPTDYRLMMEPPEQTDTPGPEKNRALPSGPISALLENNDGSERLLNEKHNLLPPARGIYLLQRG